MHNRIKDFVPDMERRVEIEEIEHDQVPANARLIAVGITPRGIEMIYSAPKPDDESAPICPDCGRRHF